MSDFSENIQKVATAFGRGVFTPSNARNLSLDVASALNWTSGEAGLPPVQIDLGNVQITRAFLGPQPAAVFSVASDDNNTNLVNEAALYAYHASVQWGLVATKDSATIFNSHWIRKNNWFHLPPIRWNEIDKNLELIEALTPDGVTEGRIDKLATSTYKPDRFLRSVDDALVDRLDYWRSETLRYSRNVQNVDENLQTLFAQLFILRTVEDRRLAKNLDPLNSVCNAVGEVDFERLIYLIGQAKSVIGGELFELNALELIPTNVLGGIINDLYIPHNLPHSSSRYNFSWIDADVLGLAYEKYLSTVLAPIAPPPQLNLFASAKRDVERVSVRKSAGVYYTPKYLVQYLTESCLDRFEQIISSEQLPRIGDFACGSGSFLVAATDSLIRRLRLRDSTRNWARELVHGKYIIGIDINERAVTLARLSLWLRFAEEPDPLPLPSLQEVIIQGDSLSSEVWDRVPKTYDLVLGNPPFLATGHTPNREELSIRFRTAQGRYDYSYLFVELAIARLNPSGLLGMVVPNRLFRNRDASIIREIISSETNLLAILDFGANEVFEKTSAYIGSIIAEKIVVTFGQRSDSVRVININSISTEFLAALLMEAMKIRGEMQTNLITAYYARQPKGDRPWLLISPSTAKTRMLLEDRSEQLSTIAGIFQGIRTGANDIFVVEIESGEDAMLAEVINGLGEYGIIERSLLHPVVFGSEIQKFDFISPKRYILYPYRRNIALSETELSESYPRTLEYLLRYRDALAERGSIEASGLKWYEIVRKRDETWLKSPKLLIRDLATETSFAIDQAGSTYLVGGTAVVPSDPEMLLPMLAYLNSQLVNDYIKQLTPAFRGGFQKFEPQHLQQIPVLSKLLNDAEFADQLAATAMEILQAKAVDRQDDRRTLEENVEQLLHHALRQNEQELL